MLVLLISTLIGFMCGHPFIGLLAGVVLLGLQGPGPPGGDCQCLTRTKRTSSVIRRGVLEPKTEGETTQCP